MANGQALETQLMSTAIAIFVKTPSLSRVKTRLAAGIGRIAAQQFYLLSLKAVQETVKNINASPYWAVGEENGLDNSLWQDFPSLYTGIGNLGQRQHHIYEMLLKDHEHVLLIGADTPQISTVILEQAITALNTNDFVVGPANDGGYYLFGGSVPIQQMIWTSVPWSTNITRERLETMLLSEPFHLMFLTDVDTQNDLQQVAHEMQQGMSKEQKNIIDWIKNHERSVSLHG
jgi:glycosyltransferase A (GT-A) superfamily protein (DUF2064 family)